MGGIGKALGGLVQGIAQIAEMVAPIANLFIPGLGTALSMGAKALSTVGSMVSSLDQEATEQQDLDRKEGMNRTAAREDQNAAETALAALPK